MIVRTNLIQNSHQMQLSPNSQNIWAQNEQNSWKFLSNTSWKFNFVIWWFRIVYYRPKLPNCNRIFDRTVISCKLFVLPLLCHIIGFQYEDTYEDYLEMCIQFGYVTLFSSAFPMAAMCALLNNVIEVRSDAFKLCMTFQRPFGQQVESIGIWQVILIQALWNEGIWRYDSEDGNKFIVASASSSFMLI